MKNEGLKIKVCGMREAENISAVSALNLDYMGFIFYPKSPRFVEVPDKIQLEGLKSKGIQPVAVFVNESVEVVFQKAVGCGFTHVQLHGWETPDFCSELRRKGLLVIKAFQMAEAVDLEVVQAYEYSCDYFLFDTKTPEYGGSGCQFDWSILQAYNGSTPFFLSGGIGPQDAEQVRTIRHPLLYGLDLNSRFEIKPALKDVDLLKNFINQVLYKQSNAK